MASSNEKMSNSFSFLFLTMFALPLLLLSQGGAVVEARSFIGVSPWCRTADHKRLCTIMVGGATTLHDASVNVMTYTRDLAAHLPELNAGVSRAVQRIPKQVTKDSITKVCNETFNGAAESLDVAIGAYKMGDLSTCLTYLSGINLADCSDALKEFGATLPLKKMAVQFEKYLSNSLAVVEQL